LKKYKIEENVMNEEGSMLMESEEKVCFEVKKDLVNEMELKKERVKIESEGE
jgi:hypothetical protein